MPELRSASVRYLIIRLRFLPWSADDRFPCEFPHARERQDFERLDVLKSGILSSAINDNKNQREIV